MPPLDVGQRNLSNHLLRDKVREAIRGGQLPARLPDNLFGGLATRVPCAVCGAMTRPGEVELELEFLQRSDGSRTVFRLHPQCFLLFKIELARLEASDAPTTSE